MPSVTTLQQLRAALGGLNNLTDEDILRFVARANGVDPDRDPRFRAMADQFAGYNRTATEKATDTVRGLVSGAIGIGKDVAILGGAAIPGVKAFDNPVYNTLSGMQESIALDQSPGLQAQRAAEQRATDIAVQRAAQQGAGTAGRIWAGLKAQGANYLTNPALAAQDVVENAPQLLASGLIGRGAEGLATAARLGQKATQAVAVGTGVAGNAALQGVDTSSDTFDRMQQSGTSYDEAAAAAARAGLKSGAVSAGLSALPGATSIERSLLRNAGSRTGSRAVGAVRGFTGEAASEGADEGYAQYAQNQEVRNVNPNVDLAYGVGAAAAKGAMAAGPMGTIGGFREAGHAPVVQPRTETGEIDLTGNPRRVTPTLGLNVGPVAPEEPSIPAYLRDPNQAPAGIRVPEAPAGEQQIPGFLRDASQAPASVQAGQLSGEQQIPGFLRNTEGVPASILAPQTAAPMQEDTSFIELAGKPFVPEPANVLDLYRPEPQDPFDTRRFAAPTATQAPARNPTAQPNVSQLVTALQKASTELGARVVRKDGEVANTAAAAPLREVLQAKSPLEKIRELYQDGKHPRDELLDLWHKELTGQTVSEAKTAETRTAPNTNSAGFVSEPLPQINAQLRALRQGRIDTVVLGKEDAAKVDLTDLNAGVATGTDGASAVVVSRDSNKVKQTVARAKQVGLKQALGEAKGVVDPTITSKLTPPPGGGVVVQRVDTQTGQPIHEEVVNPADIGKVQQVSGTATHVATPGEVVAQRQVQQVPAKGPTLAQRKSSARTEGAAAAMDGLGRKANPHKPGTAAYKEWIEGHDEVKARQEAAKENPIAKKLIEVVESTKDEQLYDDSLYALYKLAARGDVTAFNYFHENGYYNERNENGNPEKLKPAQRAEMAKLRARWDTEQAQIRGQKFGATKAIRLTNPDSAVSTHLDTNELPRDAAQLAHDLATGATNPQDREVAQRIMPHLVGVEVVVAGDGVEVPEQVAEYFDKTTGTAAGATAFDAETNSVTVYIDPRHGAREDVALHELIHAATMRAIDDPRNEALRNELESVRQAVMHALSREKNNLAHNGERERLGRFFSDVIVDGHELLAYAFSSPTLRDFLTGLDAKGDPLPRTTQQVRQVMPNLWQRLVNTVRRLVGLGPAYTPYMQTVAEGGMVITGPDTVTMHQRLDELLQQALTGPSGGGGSASKQSIRTDVLSRFGQRFGKTNPKDAVKDTQAALEQLRNLAVDYRTMAQNAMTRGKTETAQGLLDRVQTYEQQVAGLQDDLNLARAAEAIAGIEGQNAVKFNLQEIEDKSVVRPVAQAAKAVTAKIRAQAQGHELNEPLLNMLTLRQIEEQYGKKLPAFKDWTGAIFERSSKASKAAAEADRLAQRWQEIKPAEQRQLADILLRASNAELQLDDTSSKYLSELSPQDRAEHTALRSKLATLSPEAQAVRKEALDILHRQWENTRKALEKFITLTVPDPGLREKRLADLRQEFGRNRGDYFPLSRFGDEIVIARGAAADGRDVVTFHESTHSADQEVDRLKAAGAKHVIRTKATAKDVRKVATSGFIREMHQLIDSNTAGEEAESLHEALQQLYLKSLPELSGAKHMIRRENIEGYTTDALRAFADAVSRGARYASHLEFGPAVHAAIESAEMQSRSTDKRTASVVIGRKEGQDPVVKLTQTGTDRLNAVEALEKDGYEVKFFDTIPDSVVERLAAEVEEASPEQIAKWATDFKKLLARSSDGVEDLRAAKQLYNYMIRSQQVALSPSKGLIGEKGVELAGQLGYAWYLGFSPAFWAMNTLQNPMIGIPHLGAKYGVTKATRELMSAAKWFATVRLGKLVQDRATPFSVDYLRTAVARGEVKGITKLELDMLQRLEDRQVLDFTQAMDLSRIGAASNSTWYKAMRLAAGGAHHTEVFNRVSFALAAYRLALKSGSKVSHDDAVRAAEHDVAAVHFDYSYANKPLWMGKSVPAMRLIFMFQQYRQHVLYWWANTIKDAIKGDTPEERNRARKAAVLMAATQGLFAGAMGLPFVGAVATVANMLGGGAPGDEPFDFERWLREAALGATGSEQAADVLTKGIFAAMGADVSKRIGQADLLPFLNEGSARYQKDFADKTRAYIFDMLGPLGSMALGAARAVDAFSAGDTLKGLAAVAPKFASDVIRAYDLQASGLKDKRGEFLAQAEAFDGWDTAMQAFGVMPNRVSNVRQARGAVLDLQAQLKDDTQRLTKNFVAAWQHSDPEALREALADIQEYNQRVAKRGLDKSAYINGAQLKGAIMDMQRRQLFLAATGGLADNRRQLALAARASGLYDLEGRDSLVEAIGKQYGLPDLPALPGNEAQ